MVPNFDHHDPAGLQRVNGVAAWREMMTPYARGFTCGTVTVGWYARIPGGSLVAILMALLPGSALAQR
jgi:hypothetical protein